MKKEPESMYKKLRSIVLAMMQDLGTDEGGSQYQSAIKFAIDFCENHDLQICLKVKDERMLTKAIKDFLCLDNNDISQTEYSFSNVEKIQESFLIKDVQKLWDKIHGKPTSPVVWKEEKGTKYPIEFWKVVREWINERNTGTFETKSDQEINEYMAQKIRSNTPRRK